MFILTGVQAYLKELEKETAYLKQVAEILGGEDVGTHNNN